MDSGNNKGFDFGHVENSAPGRLLSILKSAQSIFLTSSDSLEKRIWNAGCVGDGVGCRLVKVGNDLDTASVGNCFSVGNGTAIAIDDRSVKNARCVGDGVVCRLVQSGMDSAAFGLSSFSSVGEGVGIAIEDDGGRSIPLVRSRVDAIDGSGEGKLVGCVAGVS